MRTKTNNPRAKTLVTVVLAIALTFTSGMGAAFAAVNERDYDPADAIGNPTEKQIYLKVREETGSTYNAPEYEEYSWMYSNFFVSALPTDKEPELLEMFTKLPAYEDMEGWSKYITEADPVFMRDVIYRCANEFKLFDLAKNNRLTLREKAKIVVDAVYAAEGFQYDGRSDGWIFDCTSTSEGILALYRIAGFPALSVSVEQRQGGRHEDPFFFADGEWRYGGANASFLEKGNYVYIESYDFTIKDYVMKKNIVNSAKHSYATVFFEPDAKVDTVMDVGETWIGQAERGFMFYLLQKPFVYPEEKLTRGMVAQLLCHYLGAVPMQKTQIFSDVPPSHKYAPYIWAMNKLGIMTGNGDGTFRPDSELSMQEFAVMAYRVMEWGKQKAEYMAEHWQETNPWADQMTPEEIADHNKERHDAVINTYAPAYSEPMNFADKDKIASWAKDAVNELSRYGYSENRILSGDENGYLKPAEMLSKVRFLVFMYKFDHRFYLRETYGADEPLF
jgi:hypothetical protein